MAGESGFENDSLGAAQVLFTARRFRVERVRQILSDGSVHQREIVRHPGAVVVLPLLSHGRIVLLRNYRVAVGRTLIELPAGTCEPNEPAMVTAARELTEETGYRARTLEPLLSFVMSPGILDERMQAFVARELTPGQQSLERGEQIEPLVVDWEQAIGMIRRGEIEDAKTIATLLYFQAFVEKDV
ncbi:MAG: NUDIX hydrolase [Planctomycetota bacterium]